MTIKEFEDLIQTGNIRRLYFCKEYKERATIYDYITKQDTIITSAGIFSLRALYEFTKVIEVFVDRKTPNEKGFFETYMIQHSPH